MLPTLLTLANLYSMKYGQYQDEAFPPVHDGVHSDVMDRLKQPFDFIVVGSGFSGSFLARKLSAFGCHRVLLLEAGGMPSFDTAIPFLSMGNMSKVTWNYLTVAQKNAAKAMKDEKVQLMVAKTFGGNSVVDSGIYLPANLDDFNRWSYTYQLPGWSYPDMKKYAFELNLDSGGGYSLGSGQVNEGQNLVDDFNIQPLEFTNQSDIKLPTILDESFHQKMIDPMKFVWLRAANQLHYPVKYGEEQDLFNEGGFFLPRTLSVKGVKMNPAAHFLKEKADNLMIICHVTAERLIFDGDGKTVRALELRDIASGQVFRADVTREVILAAGAIGSAKILLQSGIGPADHLANEGIPLFRDLPVGTRLNDRVKAHLMIKVHPVALESMKTEINDPMQMQTYLMNGTGIWANTSFIGAAYVKTGYLQTADLMLQLKPGGLVGMDRMQHEMNFKDEAMEALDPDGTLSSHGCLELVITLLRPFSQGTMWMWRHKNESRNATPRMNPGYLTDDRDISALVQGAKYAEAIIETDLFREMGAEIIYPRFADCPEPLTPVTEEYWRCVMRHMATSGHHLTSTVPFGDVIDNRLKVKGVEGVRVVDESVFPESVTGGVAASLLALANRAGQLMDEELRLECGNSNGNANSVIEQQ